MADALPIYHRVQAAAVLSSKLERPSATEGIAKAQHHGNSARQQSFPECSSSSVYSSSSPFVAGHRCIIGPRSRNGYGRFPASRPSSRLHRCVKLGCSCRLAAIKDPVAAEAATAAFSTSKTSLCKRRWALAAAKAALEIAVAPALVASPSSLTSSDLTAAPSAAAAVVEGQSERTRDVCCGREWTLLTTLFALICEREARFFRPASFNASKLHVLLLGKHDEERLLQHPRIYTLTHSDLTAKITLSVAKEINKAQVTGWYSKMQRDEVLAEWRKTKGELSLHVHCHISGTNFLHTFLAKLRYEIFHMELPLVLEAFVYGDRYLFRNHPELQNAPVWVYFHSNVEDYNRVECWGPLVDARKRGVQAQLRQLEAPNKNSALEQQFPGAAVCLLPCECCSRHSTVIPIPESLNTRLRWRAQLQQTRSKEGAPLGSESSSLLRLYSSKSELTHITEATVTS